MRSTSGCHGEQHHCDQYECGELGSSGTFYVCWAPYPLRELAQKRLAEEFLGTCTVQLIRTTCRVMSFINNTYTGQHEVLYVDRDYTLTYYTTHDDSCGTQCYMKRKSCIIVEVVEIIGYIKNLQETIGSHRSNVLRVRPGVNRPQLQERPFKY